ncbi:glycosyltransferase family 4 protein [Prosthecobacter sp. SYSU 5D2]|uniref:glycosyltransferase family 4 protein n=1 Tax=Prosthecobacter sp. SYSU 5D2 TaxID=3134134 RepID=UPI0031FE7875
MDPAFRASRPTAQSLCLALPFLLEKGWQMELWCLHHDEALDPRVKVRLLPRARWLRLLEPLWFWLAAFCLLTIRRWRGHNEDIVHTSGPDIPGADVMSLHFHNRTWIGLQVHELSHSFKDRLKILHTVIGFIQETVALSSKRWRILLPVSEGLAKRVRPQLSPDKSVLVLPNLLDEKRFNLSVRPLHRAALRTRLQADDRDYIFIFVSTGHYHRKGLWPAARAIRACREMARKECGLNLRFLVVGAGDRAQQSLIPQLNELVPGWRDWIQLVPPVTDVESWYAASDAFLFPSRYETFSLVALEASACGLPLLITPYDGHEMYLKEGINGCLLPWDQEGVDACLADFLRSGRHSMKPGPASSLNAAAYAARLDEIYTGLLQARA